MSQVEILLQYPENYVDMLQKSCDYLNELYVDYPHSYNMDDLKGGDFFVVMVDDVIAGIGSFIWLMEDVVELRHIYIESKYRGQGLGKQLLKEIEQFCRDINCVSKIVLEVGNKQLDAIGLYLKLGYKDRTPYVYNPHHTSIFMEKVLYNVDTIHNF